MQESPVSSRPRVWVCPGCRHANPLDDDDCAGCGVSFAALVRGQPGNVGPVASGGSAGSAAPASPHPPASASASRATRPLDYRAGLREVGVILGLFVLWRLIGAISVTNTASALARGRWIWRLERSWRFPSELSVQRGILAHPAVVQLVNVFYLAAHLGGLAVFLVWLFVWHREHYRRWRTVIVLFTGASLLIQLVSVAPPRLLPQFGFVDTGALYHQSAYAHLGTGMVDQLSSMPSIHVGWAVAIAIAVIRTSRSHWRWLVIAHPLATGYAVVATANHFWLDGVAAVVLLGVVLIGQSAWGKRTGEFKPLRPGH